MDGTSRCLRHQPADCGGDREGGARPSPILRIGGSLVRSTRAAIAGSRTWDRRCHHSHGSPVPAAVVSRGGRLVGPSEALRRSPWERKRPDSGEACTTCSRPEHLGQNLPAANPLGTIATRCAATSSLAFPTGTRPSRTSSPLAHRFDIRILLRISRPARSELRCARAEQDHLRLATETSPSTSAPRSSPATTSRPRSRPPSVATSTSRREARGLRRDHRPRRPGQGPQGPLHRRPPRRVAQHARTAATRRFRVYRGRTGKFVLHVERGPDFTMVDAEGKPAGWRGYLGIGNLSYGTTPAESTLEVIESLDELRERIPPQLYEMVADSPPSSRPSRTSTSDRRGRRRAAGRCAHDGRRRPGRPSAPPGSASRTASRSSSTASTSRSPRARSSRSSGRTAPARRRPSTSSRR